MNCAIKLKLFVMEADYFGTNWSEMMTSNKVCRMRIKSVGSQAAKQISLEVCAALSLGYFDLSNCGAHRNISKI